jgi:type I restriction enzyme S subunit
MSWGKFDEQENKVLPKGVRPFVEYKINEGDYLISRANTEELIGKSVIVGELQANLLLSDKSIRIKFSDFVDNHYINFYNNSLIAREYYKRVASGTSDSMKNITREQMYLLPLPLPPLAEQQRIVAKVQQLQRHLSQLEVQVQQSRQYAEQLLQSVLKEAFEEKGKVYEENEMITMAAEE